MPYQHEDIDNWRNNFRGVQYLHEPTQFLVYGAPDEVGINKEGELVVIDVKATSKTTEINLDADWQMSYKRQMTIYQWLLRRNGFNVAKCGYFVYCNGKKVEPSNGTRLEFDVCALPYEGDDTWIEPKLLEIRTCLLSDQIPDSSPQCKLCKYGLSAAKVLSHTEIIA